MKLRVPFYYDQFHCITSECKDNCCVGGWEIDIDDDTYNYYMSLDGELGDRIRESITKSEDGSNCFKLVDGHCGLLDKCGLCTIHKELGAEHLSVVKLTIDTTVVCVKEPPGIVTRRMEAQNEMRSS